MSIYPLPQLPIVPQAERLLIVSKQSNQPSQYSGKQTVIQWYSYWTLEINWPRMGIHPAETLAAWLDQLQGSYGTFCYTPVLSVYPNPAALSLATVSYPGTSIVSVQEFAAGATTNLRTGQYAQIGSQLVRIQTTPLNADSSGVAVISFSPPLRSQMAAGTAVEVNQPVGIFRLDQSNGSGFQLDPDLVPEFDKLTALEAL